MECKFVQKIIKIGAVIAAVLLLSSCNKHAQYAHLLQNPSEVQSILANCGTSQSTECQDARLVAQVFNEYVAIQQLHRSQLSMNRDVLMQLQQQGFRAQTPEQQQVLNQFATVQSSIQEQFGQKIMAAQINLVNLQQSLKGNQPPQGRQHIKDEIKHQQQMIAVMLALVSLNDPT